MTPDGVLVVRPRKLTVVCRVVAACVVVGSVLLARALGRVPEGAGRFGVADQVAMVGLGLLAATAVLVIARSQVVAGSDGIRIRNMVGEKALPWAVVAAVRFDDGSPWASLDLQDDDTVALLAVQANDGERAVDAVVELRRLLREAQGR